MRITERLTEKQVSNAKPDKGRFVKRLPDGGGLYLQATLSKTNGVNQNGFRYELDGERHDLGIGPLNTLGLAQAREIAKGMRRLKLGVDPLEARLEANESAHPEG